MRQKTAKSIRSISEDPYLGLPKNEFRLVAIFKALLPEGWDRMPELPRRLSLLEMLTLDEIEHSTAHIYKYGKGGWKTRNHKDNEFTDEDAPWVDARIHHRGGEFVMIPVSTDFKERNLLTGQDENPENPVNTMYVLGPMVKILEDKAEYYYQLDPNSEVRPLNEVVRELITERYGEYGEEALREIEVTI